jgi:hypothetical protein
MEEQSAVGTSTWPGSDSGSGVQPKSIDIITFYYNVTLNIFAISNGEEC